MTRALNQYSAELRQRLVEEIEGGQLSFREAARDAQTSLTMVQKWPDDYGAGSHDVEVAMKSAQDRM